MKLRDYQQECFDILKRDRQKQLIHLPTGSGKTVIFLKYLQEKSQKALIIVPTKDLQDQIAESAELFYRKSEIVVKGSKCFSSKGKIYIVCANSLQSDSTIEFLKKENLDHIIVDEAHKSMCKSYLDFLQIYAEHKPEFKLIGFTATPERMDKKSLLKVFDEITYSKTIFELITQGYLCDLECYRIKTKHELVTAGKTGDFALLELKRLDCYSRNALIYKTYEENCADKKTLIFCLSVEHAEKLAKYMRDEKGIKAHCISGKQSMQHRRETLQKFRSGAIQVLTNCQLLTEGFDEPSIEALIMARPTKSKSLYCQMLGRGTRLFPNKKVCYVYELTDNAHKICTFNVIADETRDCGFTREYRDGIRLTELKKELEKVSLSDYLLEKEKMDVLDSISDFTTFLQSKGITNTQKKKLTDKSIFFLQENTTFLEGNFMLFLQKLKERYGYN